MTTLLTPTKKTDKFVYVLAYASDFVTADDAEVFTSFEDAFWNLRNDEERNELTILRADDSESEFTHVWENQDWVKYC